MSLNVEQPMQVDVNKNSINNAFTVQGDHIFAVQGDHIGRKIKITFLSEGEVVNLAGCTAIVKCSANGQIIAVNNCDITDNVVTVELTKTMLAYAGKTKLQVSVTDSLGAVISTPIFYLIVSQSISTAPVEETADFSVLADLTGRIMAVLNDPEVSDTEVKDARGGYTVLGDRLNTIDNATAEIINTLGKYTRTKYMFTVANWELYNGIAMTPHADEGYISFNGVANKGQQTFLLPLDKALAVDKNKNKFILAKIRIRAVGASVTVSFRDNAYFNTANTIATNAQTITDRWITDVLSPDEWRTIWVVSGGADKTVSKIGVEPLPTTSDYELQVSSVDCYYSGDRAEVTDVIARLASAESDITALQATVNGSASASGTVKNQIATAKTEVIQGNINPLAERVTTAETNITKLKNTDNSINQRIGTVETNITQLKNRATTAESNISANATAISANTSNITANAAAISDLQAYVGYTNDDILGLQVDFENRKFTRLAGAVGLSSGTDFDGFAMYGGRRRCNASGDGTITAYYGDENYAENGSNGQVMVYQPAFYYKVVPLKLDKNTDSGIGYHIRKANYYVSATPHAGFRLHPAFYDENGNAVDYILYSAYEGSLYSNGHMVSDDSETTTDWDLNADALCSVANVKPISGLYKLFTRINAETLAKNHGTGWHIDTIKSVSANQILMMIELGTMNTQSAVGLGVVNITDDLTNNCSSVTGATSALGNSTGQATQTMNTINGNGTLNTEPGKVSVSYRGIENPWGNIWKSVNGINIWGDGTMGGGQAYIADDFNFMESKQDGNYMPVGFTLPNANGYIKAMGYSGEKYDWLFLPSENGGTSSFPVGDYYYGIETLNSYRTIRYGGSWNSTTVAGGFTWNCRDNVGGHAGFLGARLLYVPTARV